MTPSPPNPAARTSRFAQVDVFAGQAYGGNPVAVILDAEECSDVEMQRIARWTNLSETTFILPPTTAAADYRLRIFTPTGELPFAGHPTLGSCHAWLASGAQPRVHPGSGVVIQECAAGLVTVTIDADAGRDGGIVEFAAPPVTRTGELSEAELQPLAVALGVEVSDIAAHQWCVNGPEWAAIELSSVAAVRELTPDFRDSPAAMVGVFAQHEDGCEVRAFAPGIGVAEDPVTGSFNAGLAQWLVRESRLGEGTTWNDQGSCVGAAGRVRIRVAADGSVYVGGECYTRFSGAARLP